MQFKFSGITKNICLQEVLIHKAFQQFLEHDNGVSSDGFTITGHPAAIAGII